MTALDIDSFAGGGGASLGIQWATGKPIDIAINHDAKALAMHRANHPRTTHYRRNIWRVHPRDLAARHAIRLCWFSPDCTHWSRAKGAAPIRHPRQHMSRDLAWIVPKFAKHARPLLIFIENVEEFTDWGPLLDDGTPCPHRKGDTFRHWLSTLRHFGYHVEHRTLRACDYGAPTIRKRFFLVARRDTSDIRWPAPTHGPGLLPYRSAAECIDWSLPCPSIFLTPEEARTARCRRPLAEATLQRIAHGIQKFVIDDPQPFVIPVTHRGDARVHPVSEPLRTITTAHRGEFALVNPLLQDAAAPNDPPALHLSLAYVAQHNTGMIGHSPHAPLSTIVKKGCTQALVTAYLTRQFGNSTAHSCAAPAHTIMPTGNGKTGLVLAHLSPACTPPQQREHLVHAFLIKYYQQGGQWAHCADPAPTLTCRGRIGLVTVERHRYRIVDIGMRMLTPRELFRAQGFPDDYVIAAPYNGKPLSATDQIHMCGNSVCPQVPAALVRANLPPDAARDAPTHH